MGVYKSCAAETTLLDNDNVLRKIQSRSRNFHDDFIRIRLPGSSARELLESTIISMYKTPASMTEAVWFHLETTIDKLIPHNRHEKKKRR